MRFPPVMSRAQLEKSGYLKSFPNLLGCVCGLHGTEREINAAVSRFDAGGDWTSSLSPADLVLSPAACYPVYPIAASRGQLPKGGLRFDVAADCFRREPSKHLDRLQSFRMREYVCIGSPEDVADFRERWMVRAQNIATDLGLSFRVDYASDPFFGRVGQMKAVSQKQQQLKFELLIPLRSEEQPTACMSFNYHREHFGTTWESRTPMASRPIPAALPSAWTAWPSPCSTPTAPIFPPGRRRCGTSWACSRMSRPRLMAKAGAKARGRPFPRARRA